MQVLTKLDGNFPPLSSVLPTPSRTFHGEHMYNSKVWKSTGKWGKTVGRLDRPYKVRQNRPKMQVLTKLERHFPTLSSVLPAPSRTFEGEHKYNSKLREGTGKWGKPLGRLGRPYKVRQNRHKKQGLTKLERHFPPLSSVLPPPSRTFHGKLICHSKLWEGAGKWGKTVGRLDRPCKVRQNRAKIQVLTQLDVHFPPLTSVLPTPSRTFHGEHI